MDKSVRRVTVVSGSGENRQSNVVYKSDEDENEGFGMPGLNKLEKSVRHLLKAQVIAAQEAYQRHVESVEKGGKNWLFDEPGNLMKARRKAMKEMSKAAPFKMMDFGSDKDEDEDED